MMMMMIQEAAATAAAGSTLRTRYGAGLSGAENAARLL